VIFFLQIIHTNLLITYSHTNTLKRTQIPALYYEGILSILISYTHKCVAVQYKSEKSKINSVLSKTSKKVLSSPCNRAMQAQSGSRDIASSTLILTSVLDGSGWSTPRPRRSTLRERTSTHFVGGRWVPEPVWTVAGKFAPTGIRSLDGPALTGSLYQLRYPGPI
jgi:hypothetical protein